MYLVKMSFFISRFMQLNPARGRKLINRLRLNARIRIKVYAAQPREGTETKASHKVITNHNIVVYAAQPREGTETISSCWMRRWTGFPRFMQLNPARGRKLEQCGRKLNDILGLCSSTPRGDGNQRPD